METPIFVSASQNTTLEKPLQALTLAAFPSTYFYAHFGLLHKKKNAGWKRQDAHKF